MSVTGRDRRVSASTRRRAPAAVVLWVAVATLGVGGCSSAPVAHLEGDGPMSLHVPGSGSVSIRPPTDLSPDGTWSGTFGSFLPCLTTEDGPARLTGLRFADSAGPEPLEAVAYVRTFDSATGTPIASMRGAARDLDLGSSRLGEGVEGLEVGATCQDLLGFDGTTTDEILISLTADRRGARVGDMTVTYVMPDGVEHAVQVDWDLALCGSEVPDELCAPSTHAEE
ncbi:hypothetical protein [Isoptericola sp. NPDC019482]|uniref:hypothetical protein n=1 Tax=Isoptericola sp. NPDC019482 TaxID=3154688 RepID=UPI00348D6496